MSAYKRVQQWNAFARIWHVFDAKWQNPLLSAQVIKKYLTGRYKPLYHPLAQCGDEVVVINSKEIAFTEEEWRKRVYFHHTGYPGGATWTLAWELHDKDPTMILKKAIYSSMKGTLQRRYTMQRLHIFPDANIPEEMKQNITNQIIQLRQVPKRLDHFAEEEVKTFPKILDFPADYVMHQ